MGEKWPKQQKEEGYTAEAIQQRSRAKKKKKK